MASLNAFHRVNPKGRINVTVGREGRKVFAQIRHYYKTEHDYEPLDGDLLEQLLLAWAKQDAELRTHVSGLNDADKAAIERELDAEERATRPGKKNLTDV